jgi:hypothetical protein
MSQTLNRVVNSTPVVMTGRQAPVAGPVQTGPQPATAAGEAVKTTDQVQLKQPVNPYAGVADHAERVVVDRWGQGKNDSIERILRSQGYSTQEIYAKHGKKGNLLQQVATVNGLRDPNLVRSGGKGILVPAKHPKPGTPEQQTPAAKPEAAKPEAVKPEVAKPEAAKPEVTKPEAAKPEVVKPEVSSPEAAKPEVANPETAQPEAAKPKKHRGIFGWLHKRPKTEPALNPNTTPAPIVTEQAPAATNPAPAAADSAPAATNPAPAAADSAPAATNPKPAVSKPEMTPDQANAVEISLLVKGINDGSLTRGEFQGLNATANQFNELQARYAKDGFTPEQTQQMAQIQQQYGQMFARFAADDKAKVSFKVGRNDPNAEFRIQQNEEGGRLYDDYRARTISEEALMQGLISQRQKSGQLGAQ